MNRLGILDGLQFWSCCRLSPIENYLEILCRMCCFCQVSLLILVKQDLNFRQKQLYCTVFSPSNNSRKISFPACNFFIPSFHHIFSIFLKILFVSFLEYGGQVLDLARFMSIISPASRAYTQSRSHYLCRIQRSLTLIPLIQSLIQSHFHRGVISYFA